MIDRITREQPPPLSEYLSFDWHAMVIIWHELNCISAPEILKIQK